MVACHSGHIAVECHSPQYKTAIDMQAHMLHTQRTASLEVQLVDSRGYGGVASMDPAGSAVLDHVLGASANVLDAMAS